MTLKSVVLPQPDGPTNRSNSLMRASKLTSLSTSVRVSPTPNPLHTVLAADCQADHKTEHNRCTKRDRDAGVLAVRSCALFVTGVLLAENSASVLGFRTAASGGSVEMRPFLTDSKVFDGKSPPLRKTRAPSAEAPH
jgi:hypothetical protein